MTISWSFQDTVHTEFNSETRRAREYELGGEVLIRERPFTAEENAMADQEELLAVVTEESMARDAKNQAYLNAAAATTEAKVGGGAWVQPTGPADSYAMDATVSHAGKNWKSLTDYNVWEPGIAGWREEVATGYPAWVQPVGSVDAYPMFARVRHNGQNWENTGSAANVWEPGVFGWVVIP